MDETRPDQLNPYGPVLWMRLDYTSGTLMAYFHRRVRFGPSTPQLSSEGAV